MESAAFIELEYELHQSNNSKVFQAFDSQTGQRVAVKILNEEFPSPQIIARFNKEAEISQRLTIRGLRKILSKQKLDNRHALIMEYIEGITLREVIQDEHPMPLARFFELALQICGILSEAHQAGLIHKDINPRNFVYNPKENQVYMIDLGIASMSKKEYQQLQAPDKLEGTLAYISPEQTGRVNHAIDSRSDLYSLGITFYEMLTGSLPFTSWDSMELVHSHIAKMPERPREKNPNIPIILSRIVMKLLEKDVYQRYQTASGLKNDLLRCQEILQKQGEAGLIETDFELAENDVLTRFQIPEKLYGREEEREILLNAFKNVSNGEMECILVSGYSGSGKTALIRELYKPVTENRAYFLSGKFEQFQRDIPYSAFIQAIKRWVQHLLGESERRLAHWKREIMTALGNNAGVLTEVVPSLEAIIGEQAEPLPLSPVENQNRFNTVLRNFFRYLSNEKHPLVVFIDDWQWADLPSLHLLRLLTSDYANQYLCWIIAYRDNEVDESHSFHQTVQEIRRGDIRPIELKIRELGKEHIIDLLQDTLQNPSLEDLMPLAELIMSKTSGNPFFSTQFLQNLYENHHIIYDYNQQRWIWDIENVRSLPISNNVLELMTERIKKLSPESQHLLALASCIGNRFPLKLLSELAGKTQVELRQALVQVLEEGFIVSQGQNYYGAEEGEEDQGIHFAFLHDRIEKASSQGLSRKDFVAKQWQIGQIILTKYSGSYVKEHLFDLVNYLNNGRMFAETEIQKRELAEMNRKAGKKAKRTTAYASANKFFRIAREFYGENIWQRQYNKAFDLYKNSAEAAYLSGNAEKAKELFEYTLSKAQNILDKIEVYYSQITQLHTESRFLEAYELEKLGLKLLGIEIPEDDTEMLGVLEAEEQRLIELLGEKQEEDLLNLPEMINEEARWKSGILSQMYVTLFLFGKHNTARWVAAKLVTLSLEFGNGVFSSLGYVMYGAVIIVRNADIEKGYYFGDLAVQLSHRFNDLSLRARVYHMFYLLIFPWKGNPKKAVEKFAEATQFATESGNFEYWGMTANSGVSYKLFTSHELRTLHQETSELKNLLPRINPAIMNWAFIPAVHQPILNLMGLTKSLDTFDTEEFSEQVFLENHEKITSAYAWFYLAKIRNLYIFGFYEKTFGLLEKLAFINKAHAGMISQPLSQYYTVLVILANWIKLGEQDRQDYRALLEKNCANIEKYAQNNPDYYIPKWLFVQAERKAYLENNAWEALNLYDRAIDAANRAEDFQQEAFSAERAGLYFLHLGKKDLAKIYFHKAMYAYEAWGADGKIAQLKQEHPEFWLFTNKSHTRTTRITTISRGVISSGAKLTQQADSLDLLSVMKASQAISQEIKQEALLRKMIKILMENAGAERAMLIQDSESELFITVESDLLSEEIQLMRSLSPYEKSTKEYLPLKVIRRAQRNQEAIVIEDASKDRRFGTDLYLQKTKTKALLCMPVVHQGKTSLLIYMEHRSIAGAFTQARIEMLKMLSSQIAISIENAMLYNTLEQKVAERTAELFAKNQSLAEAFKTIEEKNEDIMASINYAQRIQSSILPLAKRLERSLGEYFVLFKPRDVVSGDFYWFIEREGRKFIAVIDCTGHGVPGAFMSMIGYAILNQIVTDQKVYEVHEILAELHKDIQYFLRQKYTENRDGMDMAICMIQENEQILECAGAKNPICYIQNGIIEQIKTDRTPIGGMSFKNETERIFTKHQIKLDQPTVVYLFTDGYQDQFDENMAKKFLSKNLRNLLLEIHQKPMETQGQILDNTITQWMGKGWQLDDITVLGFRC